VGFAAITFCVASQRVFVVVSVYFVIDSVSGNFRIHPTGREPLTLKSLILLRSFILHLRFCHSNPLDKPEHFRPNLLHARDLMEGSGYFRSRILTSSSRSSAIRLSGRAHNPCPNPRRISNLEVSTPIITFLASYRSSLHRPS
jgi:hypothetical protein